MSDTANAASKDTPSNFMRDLGDAISRNPVPAALVGMGVVWLFSGRKAHWAASSVRSGLDWASEAASHAGEAASSTLRAGAQYAGTAARTTAETVQDSAARFGERQVGAPSDLARSLPEEGTMIEGVRSSLTESFQRQPLALGAIGLAIGAGLAAALPSTRVEADYLGETSDAFKKRAQEFASEQAARARQVSEKALDAAAEEARRQHLTTEDAKSAAGATADKLHRVADAAAQAASAKADATQ